MGPSMASKAKNMHQKVHFPWVGEERGARTGGGEGRAVVE